ncbi:MAG: hypothetical protein Q9195_007492 [Heterodermia aff. obscurata]
MTRFSALLAAAQVLLTFVGNLPSTAASPLLSIFPRQDDSDSSDSTGYPRCHVGPTQCPGLWPSVDPSTPPALNRTLFEAIDDAGLLATAALKAIPAAHFDYFFERTGPVTSFLTRVFSNVADCAFGKTCQFSLVFADNNPSRSYGWCKNAPSTYSYATSTTQTAASGGGISWLCPASLALPRNPVPCTTDGDPSISLGYALLRALVQEVAITDPDNSGTLFDGLPVQAITENKNSGNWSLKEIGWGDDGNGLMAKGVGNAANLALFATLSWDIGYGPAPWNGTTCQSRWTEYASNEGLVPIS